MPEKQMRLDFDALEDTSLPPLPSTPSVEPSPPSEPVPLTSTPLPDDLEALSESAKRVLAEFLYFHVYGIRNARWALRDAERRGDEKGAQTARNQIRRRHTQRVKVATEGLDELLCAGLLYRKTKLPPSDVPDAPAEEPEYLSYSLPEEALPLAEPRLALLRPYLPPLVRVSACRTRSEALEHLDRLIKSPTRLSRVMKHPREIASDWYIPIGPWYNATLDMGFEELNQNAVGYAAWTQGNRFSVNTGDVFHRGELSAQVVRGGSVVVTGKKEDRRRLVDTVPLQFLGIGQVEMRMDDLIRFLVGGPNEAMTQRYPQLGGLPRIEDLDL